MPHIFLLITIFTAHFIGDYILQTYKMKIDKSSRIKVLLGHVLIYTFTLIAFLSFMGYSDRFVLLYSLFNGIMHFIIDYISGRIIKQKSGSIKIDPDDSKPAYLRVNLYPAIALLGTDQLLHHITLIASLSLFM